MSSKDCDPSAKVVAPDILTTHFKRFHPAWTSRTVLMQGFHDEAMRRFPRQLSPWRSLVWSWRLFFASKKYRAVITGSEHVGHGFAVLQSILRRKQNRIPHVIIDFPWASSPGLLTLALKCLQMKLEGKAITRILAHASPEEAERFATALHLPLKKFTFVPYHHTLYRSQYEISEGDYIFAGGDHRDYATLIRAVGELPVRTIICARMQEYFDGLRIPANVEVFTASQDEFDRLLARSAVVAVPLPAEDIHTGGHTVIANAMTMGKPIVVAGRREYRVYIQDGITGLLVPPGDVEKLRKALRTILEAPEFARQLGRNAKLASSAYAPEVFFGRVFEIIDAATTPEDARREHVGST